MAGSVMVDWVTGQLEARSDGFRSCSPSLFSTGRVQMIDRQGYVTKEFAGRTAARGSFDSSISFRAPAPHKLEMSGNPVKFLQGHNLFGSADHLSLFLETGRRTGVNGALFPEAHEFAEFEFMAPRFTRIDLTRSYRFASNERARAWIRSVAAGGHTRHGNAISTAGTVYFGKHSSRWSFKIYAKHDEINARAKGHGLSTSLTRSNVLDLGLWAEGVVRFELTIRSKELQKYLRPNGDLNMLPFDLWSVYYSRVSFANNSEVFAMGDLERFPSHLRMAVVAWRAGNDLRLLYSKNQYYRNRKALLLYGLDVSVPADSANALTVASDLDPELWDPEPIRELMWRPDLDTVNDYGL